MCKLSGVQQISSTRSLYVLQRCGRQLYDDFEELRPGALEDLERMLNKKSGLRQRDGNGVSDQRDGFLRAFRGFVTPMLASVFTRRSYQSGRSPSLSLRQVHTPAQHPNAQPPTKPLFLLMCIPYQKYGTRLVHMELADLQSDELFFNQLKAQYHSMRGQWASFFSPWKLTQIQFVKFELHKNALVDKMEKDNIPPPSKADEYRYRPIPAETIPPVGVNYLMHLYEHPENSDDTPFCLERIPKKLREQLKLSLQRLAGLLG